MGSPEAIACEDGGGGERGDCGARWPSVTSVGTADAMLPPRHRSLVQRAMELRPREWHRSVATAASSGSGKSR